MTPNPPSAEPQSSPSPSPLSLPLPLPLLTIVVPALNVDRELRRCIDSVRLALPADAPCELVLVLPPNATEAARAEYADDARVVAESRAGVYAALNDGVTASRGRYLYFLGKDDILLPAARELLTMLARDAPSVVFADVYWGSRGRHRTDSSRWTILLRNVCHQGIVYSRDAVLCHGPFVRRFRVRADQLLNIRVLWDAALRRRSQRLAQPLAWYGGQGLSFTTPDRVFYRVQPAIIRRYAGRVAACAWWAWKRLRPEAGTR